MSGMSDRDRDMARMRRVVEHVVRGWRHSPAEGLESILTGNPDTTALAARDGASSGGGAEGAPKPFWSVKARQIDLWSLLLHHLIADIEKANLHPLWTSGGPEFDRQVARALWRIGPESNEHSASSNPPTQDASLPAQAVTLARVISSYQDRVHRLESRLTPTTSYPGHLISHSHDPLRLRRAGKAAWVASIIPLLDTGMIKPGGVEEVLDGAWELIVTLGHVEMDLRFKDGDSWTEYNTRFGFGSLREAVVSGLERAARRIGMVDVFGANPETFLEGIFFSLQKLGLDVEPQDRQRIQGIVSSLAPVRAIGLLHPAIELDIAEGAPKELIDLAVALFPGANDFPALNDNTLFQAIDGDLSAMASGAEIAEPRERQSFAQHVELFCRCMRATLVEPFTAWDLPPGRSTELLGQLMKLDASNWWREAARRSIWLTLRLFGSSALKRSHSELDPHLASVLQQYSITPEGWESHRADCRLAPRTGSYSEAQSRATIESLMRYFWDRLVFIALEPDGPNHIAHGRGVADFTAEGALLRFMALFREFRAPVPPKPLGDPTAERQTDRTMREALSSGDVLNPFANFLIWQVLLQRLRNLAERAGGQEADDQSWFDAARISGALGFCADYLFGRTTGLSQVPLSSYPELHHPAIPPAIALWKKARDAEDIRSELADWARRQGDAAALDRLYSTREALNRAVRHHLQDMMSPGYLLRMLKESRARDAADYWRSPD
ncbi:hypothetical protein DLREEDagr8_06350 [Dongia sp. agr-C8]